MRNQPQTIRSGKFVLLRRNPSITSEWRAIAIYQSLESGMNAFKSAVREERAVGLHLEFALSEYIPKLLIAKTSVNNIKHMKYVIPKKQASSSLIKGFGLKERFLAGKQITNTQTQGDTNDPME